MYRSTPPEDVRFGQAAQIHEISGLAATLLLLAALFVFSDGQPPAGPKVFADITRLEQTVTRLRRRPFTRTCKKGVKTTPELTEFLTRSYAVEYPPPLRDFYLTLWREFNLVPDDFSHKDTMINLLSVQIAGFYDPETGALYVTERAMAFSEIILVHELMHALQDCYLPLNPLLYLEDLGFKQGQAVRNDDVILARMAFVEGEAQLVTSRFIESMGRIFTPEYLKKNDYGQMVSSHIQLTLTPPIIANTLMFPYTRGLNFMEVIYRINGWKTINHAYKRLPRSTEQIIHPEKYVRGEDPVMIRIKPIKALVAAGWKRTAENSLGEFMVNEIIRGLTGGFARGIRASCGWGGDSLLVFEKKDKRALLWYTTWDTVKDADEFFKYLGEGLDKQPAKDTETLRSDATQRLTRGKDRHTWLTKKDQDVIYAAAPDEAALAVMRLLNPAMIEKLTWKERFGAVKKDAARETSEKSVDQETSKGETHD
ncbi:hypothetical protein ACFL4W_01745 [Planctomycetota bacterium]